MPDDAVDKLEATLSAQPVPSSSASAIAKSIANSVPISIERLTPIIDAIVAMYLVRAQAERRLDRFIKDIVAAYPGLSEIDAKPADVKRLQQRLERILGIGSLTAVVKAFNLRSEYPDLYCTARVLTDLRPIWPQTEPETPPQAAVITHVLKLEYHHGTMLDHRELYVGMSGDDLGDLIKVLQRAQRKHKSLTEVMKRAQLADLSS